MNYLLFLLLFAAYTMGIATLVVQIIGLRKGVEYRETVFLTAAFLLLIVAFTLQKLIPQKDTGLAGFKSFIQLLSVMLLAVAVSVNIHKERLVSRVRLRNLLVVGLGMLGLTVCALMNVLGNVLVALAVSSALLYGSVVYSMVLILNCKPAPLLQHRNREERRIAGIVMAIMIFSLLIFAFVPKTGLVRAAEQYGAYVLSVVCIVLSLSKLPHDLRRLSDFTQPRRLNTLQLERLGISAREREVIELIIKGMTNKEIAGTLFISLPTVKTHVSNIYAKLNVRNRLELSNLINSAE